MRKFTERMLSWYDTEELLKLRKVVCEYIVPCDKMQIKWKVMNVNEMVNFLNNNCYDNNNDLIYWIDQGEKTPLGMTFLTFPPFNEKIKFLVGVIKSNFDKELIIGCVSFIEKLSLGPKYETVTSIETIEVNYFYQEMGILSLMLESFAKIVSKDQNIIMTVETLIGKKCCVMERLHYFLIKEGFKKDIRTDESITGKYLKTLIKRV